MDQPFMFVPYFNLFADNGKLVKKNTRKKNIIFMAVSVGFILVCSIFGMLFLFGKAEEERRFSENVSFQNSFFDSLAMQMMFMSLITILFFIGIVNLLESFEDKESSYVAKSFLFFARLFLIAAAAFFFGDILSSLLSLAAKKYLLYTLDNAFINNIFFFSIIPDIIFLFWSVSGIVFIRSFRLTCSGVRLQEKGAGFFGVCSVIGALCSLIVGLSYNICDFKNGVFYNWSSLTDAVTENIIAIVTFNMFFVAIAFALFSISAFTTDFNKMVKLTRLSFQAKNAELYMNGNTQQNHQAFYQQTNVEQQTSVNQQKPVKEQECDETGSENNAEQISVYKTVPVPKPSETTIICRSCGMQNPSMCTYCTECGRLLNG